MMSKEAMKLALETSEGIVNADWRKWDELASPSEFERWAKSRANFMATILREALAEQPAQQEQNRQIDQLIQERDHRDEIIDKLCDAVLGPDRYEWSSQYFFEDAVREVEERMAEKPAQQEPYCYTYTENGEEYFAPPMAYVPDDAKPLYTSTQSQQEPEYAWPTVADYERDVYFQTNEAFRIAWNMARTTNRMLGHASSQPAQRQARSADTWVHATEWVGLTDEEIKKVCDENFIMLGAYAVDFIQSIEAKLREKNT